MKKLDSAPSIAKLDADVWCKTLKFFQVSLRCSSEVNRCGGGMCQFLPAGNFKFYGRLKG